MHFDWQQMLFDELCAWLFFFFKYLNNVMSVFLKYIDLNPMHLCVYCTYSTIVLYAGSKPNIQNIQQTREQIKEQKFRIKKCMSSLQKSDKYINR